MEGAFIAQAAAFFGAAFAMGIGSIGPSIGQGLVGKNAVESIGKYPESAGNVRMTMMIAMGIIESSAIYSFLIAIVLIMVNR